MGKGLEPGVPLTISQRFPHSGEVRTITGYLKELSHDFHRDEVYYEMSRSGPRIALGGGPMHSDMTLTIAVDEMAVDTYEAANRRAQKKTEKHDDKEQPEMETKYVVEYVRDPRTKIYTLYLRDVNADDLYYTVEMEPTQVAVGVEPPVFGSFPEPVFVALQKASKR